VAATGIGQGMGILKKKRHKRKLGKRGRTHKCSYGGQKANAPGEKRMCGVMIRGNGGDVCSIWPRIWGGRPQKQGPKGIRMRR